MPQRPIEANEDIRAFLSRFSPALADAGVTITVRDSGWMRPGGAKASEYRTNKTQVDEQTERTRQYRGGMLAELSMGHRMRRRLHIGGPNEDSLHFEIRDQDGNVKVLGKETSIAVLEEMVDSLVQEASKRLRTALRLRSNFHLME